jgi:hypothetical protein
VVIVCSVLAVRCPAEKPVIAERVTERGVVWVNPARADSLGEAEQEP